MAIAIPAVAPEERPFEEWEGGEVGEAVAVAVTTAVEVVGTAESGKFML